MASQTADRPTPSAQTVGNAFVEQYYHILHQSPELVYRFYQDSSVLTRPDANGVMTSVTTMQGINEKILSLNFKDFKAEIKTADAQKSYQEGVTVLVTGCLTDRNNLRRKFAQSFFLAPQDNGYFVLNDVFRYVEDSEPLEQPMVNGVDAADIPVTSDPDPVHVSDPHASDPANSHVDEDQNIADNSHDESNHETHLLSENEGAVEPHSQSDVNDDSQATEVEVASSSAPEDAPKKSYASIVKVPRGSSGSTKIYVPTNTVKAMPSQPENQSAESVVPAAVPNDVSTPDSNDIPEEAEGHSIYIRNLPLNVTPAQLEVIFKKFGPIKQEGIQVRNNKQQGYCFGFVEFQTISSMNSAIQASPITIGGRQAVVEIKRTTTRVGPSSSVRNRFPPGRGGFRSDIFRGRGNYGGGRGFGRNDYGNRGDFSGRGRGPGVRGEGFNQQGRGRGGRSNGQKQNAFST